MRLPRSLAGVVCLFVFIDPFGTAADPWVRAYGESLHSAHVYARGGHAVLARNDELITIDAAGSPLHAATVAQRWQMAIGPGGEILRSDSQKNVVFVDRFAADLGSGSAYVYTFPENLLLGAIAAAGNGSFFVAANEQLASVVIELNPDGTPKWATRLDASGDEVLKAVAGTRDGGCVAAGSRNGFAWIVKLDRDGHVQWHRTYAYTRGGFEGVLETAGGAIVATGELGGRLAVVRFTSSGAAVWQKLFSEAGTGFTISETGTGAFVLGGTGVRDWSLFVLLELKADGTAGWKRRLSAPKSLPINLAAKDLVAVAGTSVLVGLPHRENDQRVVVTSLDATSGNSACEWWTDLGGEWSAGEYAGEDLSFETAPVTVAFAKSSAKLTPSSISSATVTCGEALPRDTDSKPASSKASFDPNERITKLRERYFALVRNKQLDELDAEADRLRREHPFGDPLWWDIDIFYDAIVSLPGTSEAQRSQFMRDWVTSRPKSITARVALAKVLVRAAEARRGSGYSDTVTEAGWQEYDTLMREAQATLARAGKDGEADPQYWMMQVAFDHELSDVDVRETVRRAAKLHQYSRIFINASHYMLPKWGGTPAKYLDFADEAARLTKQTFGDGLYAMIALYVRTDERYAQDYEPKIDKARVRKGLRDLISMAPDWIPTIHGVARLARELNDRDLAREIFLMPQSAWYDAGVGNWGSRAHYDVVRKWALSKPAEPFLENDAAKWPPIVMQTELALSSGTHKRIGAFLLKTPSGIAAVSVVPEIANRPDSVSAVGETRRHLLKWVSWPAGQPNRRVELSMAAVPTQNWARATLLAVAAGKTDQVHVLEPAESLPADVLGAPRHFVVGCTWTGDSCKQTIMEVQPQGGHSSMYILGVRQPISSDAFIGGAVLDEDGRVVAVVTGQTPSFRPEFATNLQADDLSMVLGSKEAPVSPSRPAVETHTPSSTPLAKSLPPALFTELPFAKWPQIIMQNDLVLTSGRHTDVGSFLVETASGVFGVTVVPEAADNPIRNATTHLTKWSMWSPAAPKRVLTVAGFATTGYTETQRGVAVTFSPFNGQLPVKVLKIQSDANPFSSMRSCFLVGCLWIDGTCKQTVVDGEIVGAELDTSRVARRFSIDVKEPMASFTGAAVLDAQGAAFAVVTGTSFMGDPSRPNALGAESLLRVLPPSALPGKPEAH